MLTVSAATKAYSETPLFRDVTFELDAGAAIALVGENGAGKSTLLRCIVGSDELDDGIIEIFGQPLLESDTGVRRITAALLDDADYFPDLSVLEHLRLIAWLHGTDDADAVTREVIQDVHLGSAVHQLPPTLSSGQRHRLGLAACFVRPRKLLVLDEPEQRLDAAGREWLKSRLLQEKCAGTALLFSSHDPAIVADVADHVIAL